MSLVPAIPVVTGMNRQLRLSNPSGDSQGCAHHLGYDPAGKKVPGPKRKTKTLRRWRDSCPQSDYNSAKFQKTGAKDNTFRFRGRQLASESVASNERREKVAFNPFLRVS